MPTLASPYSYSNPYYGPSMMVGPFAAYKVNKGIGAPSAPTAGAQSALDAYASAQPATSFGDPRISQGVGMGQFWNTVGQEQAQGLFGGGGSNALYNQSGPSQDQIQQWISDFRNSGAQALPGIEQGGNYFGLGGGAPTTVTAAPTQAPSMATRTKMTGKSTPIPPGFGIGQTGNARGGGVVGATGTSAGSGGALGPPVLGSGSLPGTVGGRQKRSATAVGNTGVNDPNLNTPESGYVNPVWNAAWNALFGGGVGGVGNLTGAANPGGGSGVWGAIPNVPDPTTTAGQAIEGDLSNLAGLLGLAGQTNTFNNQQAIAPYIANLPGYQNMVGQSSQNILAGLQGQVPQDVLNILQQQAAERGVATGQGPGGDNTNAAYLRALGLTSLGQQQQAEQNLTGAIQRTPTAPLFNVASFMNTPADQQAAQMAANLYASAPNPMQQGQYLENLFKQFLAEQSGAGGAGATTVNRGNLGGGAPTDLFGNPISSLGAGAGGPGEVGGGGNPYGGAVTPGQGSTIPPGYPFMPSNPYTAGDATGALTGTMPPGGYGTAQGPNQGTGEGTLSSGYWDSLLGELSGSGATGGVMPPGGYGQVQGGGVGTGEGGPLQFQGSFPSGINPNDPIWQSILDPVGYYMGDYGASGQASQDITPQGLAGGLPDYLSGNFDWQSLMNPYSNPADFSGGGFDLGGG